MIDSSLDRGVAIKILPDEFPSDPKRLASCGRGLAEPTLFALLDCGNEEHVFARVRSDACRREFRVVLSCKKRGFCPLPGLGRSTGESSTSF